MKLDHPIQLGISKSQVRVQYPLKYRKHFPAQLYEKVMSTVWPFCSEGIINSDGEIVADSTCGFQTDMLEVEFGQPIVDYSGGFCCSCPAMTVLTGMSDGVYRGDCGLLSSNETAHCLEFSDTMFAGYSIGDFEYDYDITLDLTYKSNRAEDSSAAQANAPQSDPDPAPGSSKTSRILTEISSKKPFFNRVLSDTNTAAEEHDSTAQAEDTEAKEPKTEEETLPNSTGQYESVREVLSINRRAAKNKILSAEIVGDYMPLKPPPDLKDKIFLRPLPKELPVDVEGRPQNDWMVVAADMVSMDGAECDKIGEND